MSKHEYLPRADQRVMINGVLHTLRQTFRPSGAPALTESSHDITACAWPAEHSPEFGDGDAIASHQGFMSRYQSYLGARAFTAWQYLPPTHESSRGSITLPYLFES